MMSAVSTSRKKIPNQTLNQKVPENPKYKNVKSVINTGAAAKNTTLPNRLRDSQKQQDEVFKRIKLSTFVSLMVEVAKDELNQESHLESTTTTPQQTKPQNEHLSSLHSVISGIGELDCKQKEILPIELKKSNLLSPYLLLDVRIADFYQECHITTAKSYPSSMLCRTCNYETKDLLAYKNVPMCIIVLYDDDETIAPRVAATLTQRGYDNIFMLSGGLKLASTKFKDGLIIGKLPENYKATERQKSASRVEPNVLDLKLRKKMELNRLTLEDLELIQRQLEYSVPTTTNSNSKYCQSRASTARSTSSTFIRSATSGRVRAWR